MDVHAPLRKVNKYKLKFRTKPWITPALQKSISIKNNLLKKFITAKDPQVKVPVDFKMMNVVVSFTLFENCRKHIPLVWNMEQH